MAENGAIKVTLQKNRGVTMSAKNLQTYLAVGLGLFCVLKGYTAMLVLLVVVELLFSRAVAKEDK
jgi:hypothetical protein